MVATSEHPAAIQVQKNRTRKTVSAEMRRAIAAGFLETASTTFLLLIAVQWFHAGSLAKALIASANSVGFLLTPLVMLFVARSRVSAARAAAALAFLGGAVMVGGAFVPSLAVFVVLSVVGIAAVPSAIPLITHIYHDNYPQTVRGKLFSRSVSLRIVSAGLFSVVVGWWLSRALESYPYLIVLYGVSLLYSSYCFWQIPSEPLRVSESRQIARGFLAAQHDVIFRQTLISWMFLGFSNFMLLPIRVEYLANPQYGIHYSPAEVAFIISVVPSIARLIATPIFGWLFDRINFFVMRIVANICFVASALSFFTTESYSLLIVGSAVFGVATAGGEIAWSLWVTKIAPPGKVAQYMSVHTFLSGIRGVIAPFVAYLLLRYFSVSSISIFASGLMLFSIVFLIPQLFAPGALAGRKGRVVATPPEVEIGTGG